MDFLKFYRQLSQQGGDLVPYQLPMGQKAILLNHPRFVNWVLVKHAGDYDGFQHPYKKCEPYLTDEGKFLLRLTRERAKESLEAFCLKAEEKAQELVKQWAGHDSVDVHLSLKNAMYQLMVETLFGLKGEGHAFIDATHVYELGRFKIFEDEPEKCPPSDEAFAAARACQFQEISALLDRRSAVIGSDPCPERSHGAVVDGCVEDAVMKTLLNGYMAPGLTLSWALWLLANHPQWQEQAGDRQRLRWILEETMRMYPTAWLTHRVAKESHQLDGCQVEQGTLLTICSYTLHRHPAFWEEPDQFNPLRFQDASPGLAFIPMGAGPHGCAAAHVVMPFLVRFHEVLLKHYSFSLASEVRPKALISLRPWPNLMLKLRKKA